MCGNNMFNLHSKIERHNCGHKEFSCAEECKITSQAILTATNTAIRTILILA